MTWPPTTPAPRTGRPTRSTPTRRPRRPAREVRPDPRTRSVDALPAAHRGGRSSCTTRVPSIRPDTRHRGCSRLGLAAIRPRSRRTRRPWRRAPRRRPPPRASAAAGSVPAASSLVEPGHQRHRPLVGDRSQRSDHARHTELDERRRHPEQRPAAQHRRHGGVAGGEHHRAAAAARSARGRRP